MHRGRHMKLPAYEDIWNICKDYAARELKTTMKVRRGRRQCNESLVQFQTACGKLGEYYAWYWLLQHDFECDPPDLNVYTRHKSYDADLHAGVPIHVKTQTKESGAQFGRSWMFQLAGVTGGDGVLTRCGEAMIFVTIDLETKTGEIVGPFRSDALIDLYRDPKLDRLKGIKSCIYYDDVRDLETWDLSI